MKKYIRTSYDTNIDKDHFDPDPSIRREIARRTTDPELLSIYAYDPDVGVKYDTAMNPHTRDEDVLNILLGFPGYDPNHDDCCYLYQDIPIQSRNIPLKSLFDAVADDSAGFQVRALVATIRGTPPELLRKLSEDNDDTILQEVAYNPSTPTDVLVSMAHRYDSDPGILSAIAYNSQTPVDALTELAKASYPDVRETVAINPNTPVSVLEMLASEDKTDYVRTAAKNELRRRLEESV